ncbi:DinB family protein [Changchengzhania lutea]|uniref:DinB family protein n=1 Tax=Changchengzhania lutea TaxID=2049305 RepID=UPI00115CAD1A|nr:DinB family protein [Changchengzhania lutea]
MTITFEVLFKTRKFFRNYIENTSLSDLNKIPKGFNNNIIWNIGHIVVTEQLLAYRLSGLPTMVSDDLIDKYKKGSKPESEVTQQEVDEINTLLFRTIESTQADYNSETFKNFQEYTVSTTGNTLSNIDDALEFILFHEGMHLGYVMALYRAIKN